MIKNIIKEFLTKGQKRKNIKTQKYLYAFINQKTNFITTDC